MNRRAFLIASVVHGPVAVSLATIDPMSDSAKPLSFRLAGAKYHPASEQLSVGQQVELRAEVWMEKPCYAIYRPGNERVGYVPKQLVAAIEQIPWPTVWRVSKIDPHALPWNRCWISSTYCDAHFPSA